MYEQSSISRPQCSPKDFILNHETKPSNVCPKTLKMRRQITRITKAEKTSTGIVFKAAGTFENSICSQFYPFLNRRIPKANGFSASFNGLRIYGTIECKLRR